MISQYFTHWIVPVFLFRQQRQNGIGTERRGNSDSKNGWQVPESASVQPVFLSQEQAIDYASCRARALALAKSAFWIQLERSRGMIPLRRQSTEIIMDVY
jgi:hypothetical protein